MPAAEVPTANPANPRRAAPDPSLLAPPSADASLSSGPSPTLVTLHLIGAGKVGRALLRRLSAEAPRVPIRLVAVSDRSGTVFSPTGLDPLAIARFKDSGRPLAAHPRAAGIALDVATSVANARIVVDATSSDLATAARAAATRRATALLDDGRHVVLAAKTPLLGTETARDAERSFAGTRRHTVLATPCGDPGARDLLAPARRERLHVNALFGGTGAALWHELAELRAGCTRLVAVPNATTTAVLDARAAGASLREALAQARALGLTEHEPLQDLDGRDAALKLALLARVVFGLSLRPEAVDRPGARALLAARPRPGRTIRLVGRVTRDGAARLELEEVAPATRLATTARSVVYAYELAGGATRVHVGHGVGPDGTASALLADLQQAIASERAAARRAA